MKYIIFALLCLRLAYSKDPCSNFIVNEPMYPINSKGNFRIEVSGCYFSSEQEDFDFSVENEIYVPVISPTLEEIEQLNNLVNSCIQNPKNSWDLGFQVGLSYLNFLDGWESGLQLTYYNPRSQINLDITSKDNTSLITLLSSFSSNQGSFTYARNIQTQSRFSFYLADAAIRRAYWTSKRTHLRPALGFRYGKFENIFLATHMGGSWSPQISPFQNSLFSKASIETTFHGLGPFSELQGAFHLGLGFEIYAIEAVSLIYGNFYASHEENNFSTTFPYEKTKILDYKNRFKTSRTIFDTGLGICYRAQMCENCYELEVKFGWQHHLFCNYNQYFRVSRIGNISSSEKMNNSGENVFTQLQGNLSVKGWILNFSLLY